MTTPELGRKPEAFAADDPALVNPEPEAASPDGAFAAPPAPEGRIALPTAADLSRGVRWGAILLGALVGLAALATSVWFARFASVALAREDWVGWTAFALLAIAAAAALFLVGRELVGLARLGRLTRLKKEAEAALRTRDLEAERAAVQALRRLLSGRPELAWALARFREHERDVRDPGELLALADRDLIAPLDREAKRVVLSSAKRVSMVTALSPMALIAVVYVLIENLRMLRALATLYGGRPGFIGGLRLARMVVAHLVATGGVALTDDLLGQFLGQDLLRRLSRRLGEGVFNAALTARIGTVGVEVTRPLPCLEAPPVRLRDVMAELLRRSPAAKS